MITALNHAINVVLSYEVFCVFTQSRAMAFLVHHKIIKEKLVSWSKSVVVDIFSQTWFKRPHGNFKRKKEESRHQGCCILPIGKGIQIFKPFVNQSFSGFYQKKETFVIIRVKSYSGLIKR